MFIQVIRYQTDRPDEVAALGEKYQANLVAGRGPTRVTVAKDRDVPNGYVHIVQFADYESAMANSDAPETQELSAAMGALCTGAPEFLNLDVIDSFAP